MSDIQSQTIGNLYENENSTHNQEMRAPMLNNYARFVSIQNQNAHNFLNKNTHNLDNINFNTNNNGLFMANNDSCSLMNSNMDFSSNNISNTNSTFPINDDHLNYPSWHKIANMDSFDSSNGGSSDPQQHLGYASLSER